MIHTKCTKRRLNDVNVYAQAPLLARIAVAGYTEVRGPKQRFRDNFAEQMPSEKLSKCIQTALDSGLIHVRPCTGLFYHS